MAHKIFGTRFRSREQAAWHNIGIVFPADTQISPEDAVKQVAGDITVESAPMYYEHNGQRYDAEQRAIIRLPTAEDPAPKVFGIASSSWHPESYPTLARALNRIDTNVFKVETAGLLSSGELLFLCLRGENWDVLGDAMRSYLAFNLSLKPGVGHRAMTVQERIVCHNTNEAAIASASIDLRIPHSADAAQQIGICGDLMVRYKKAQNETKAIFEAFASTPAPEESVAKILDAAFPLPALPPVLRMMKKTLSSEEMVLFQKSMDAGALASLTDAQERYEKSTATTLELREAGLERFEAFRPENLRGTVWAAYNAATEVSDWRGDGKKVGESTLIGSRAAEKVRAFGAAMELVK